MKLLIFDWDGTVMDSSARIVSSMRAGAAEIALEVPSEDAVRDIIGLGLSEAIDILVPGISARDNQRLAQAYAKHYRDLDKTPTPLYPQVRETLTNLKSKGYQLAVATGKSRAGIDRVFAQTALGELFDFSRGADETRSKPDPLMLYELLEEAQVEADCALMIGDTTYDIEMARNAGIKSLAVSYGMHSLERMRIFQPAAEINRFSQIESWLAGQQERVE